MHNPGIAEQKNGLDFQTVTKTCNNASMWAHGYQTQDQIQVHFSNNNNETVAFNVNEVRKLSECWKTEGTKSASWRLFQVFPVSSN